MARLRYGAVCAGLLLLLECCHCFATVNKCCAEGEHFNSYFRCAKIPATNESTAAPALPLKEDYLGYNFTANFGVRPCTGRTIKIALPNYYDLNPNGSLTYYDDDRNFTVLYSNKAYCIEEWSVDTQLYNIAQICPCLEHLCINKCCLRKNQIYRDMPKDGKNGSHFCGPSKEPEIWHHGVLKGSKITRYHEVISTLLNCTELNQGTQLPLMGEYYIQDDGTIVSEKDGSFPPEHYCGDYTTAGDGGARVSTVLVCAGREGRPLRSLVYGALSLVGAAFLLLTVVLHVWLPELSGLPARSLAAHAGCLLLAYLCVAFNHLAAEAAHNIPCYVVGYLMQFSFLAAFFWLNAMCVDMSWTFSGVRPAGGSPGERDRRKFRCYSLYAWGGSVALTAAAVAVDFVPGVPPTSPFKPNFGVVKCWFNTSQSLLLYFYGPMGILLLTNLGLFVYTSWRIIVLSRGTGAIHQEDSARHHGNSTSPTNKDRERFLLYGKLFSLMGVTWLTELISWAVGGPNYFWYFTDVINVLRAVVIFIIFCWKPKIWRAVKKRLAHLRICRKFVSPPPIGTGIGTRSTNSSNKTSISKTDCIEMDPK